MHELSLFTGAGGGLLGTHLLGWRPVCAVEIEPYCREVLLRRQRDGVLPLFPIWDDVRTFDGQQWRGLVDVVTGGFPCQPFSVAGKGLGIDDPRNMWPETIRVIRDVGPRFCLLENVPGLLAHQYFGTILGDLVESGFRVRWDCFSAASVGAHHRRDRLWIVAESTGARCQRGEERCVSTEEGFTVPCEGVSVADASFGRFGGEGGREIQQPRRAEIVGTGEEVADSGCRSTDAHESQRLTRRSDSTDAGTCCEVANADETGRQQYGGAVAIQPEHATAERGGAWWDEDPADDPESGMGRVAHELACGLDKSGANHNGGME